MITSSTDFPQNRSRTSTHAMIVPTTRFTTVTINAWETVSLTAAQVWSLASTST
jgi:hypothetical protein